MCPGSWIHYTTEMALRKRTVLTGLRRGCGRRNCPFHGEVIRLVSSDGGEKRRCQATSLRFQCVFGVGGNLKHYAAIFVLLAGGLEVEIGQRDFVPRPGVRSNSVWTLGWRNLRLPRLRPSLKTSRVGPAADRVRGPQQKHLPLGRCEARSALNRRYVGSGSGSTAIEHCRTALIVWILARISLVVCWSAVDGIGHGDRDSVQHRRSAIALVSVITRALLAILLAIVNSPL